MVARCRIGDPEADRHTVEERRRWREVPPRGEVGAYQEHELVDAGAQLIAVQQGRVRTPVLVREHGFQERARLVVAEAPELDRDTGGGLATRYVEHVRAEAAHQGSRESVRLIVP